MVCLFFVFQPRNTINRQWAELRSSNYKSGLAFPKPCLA